MANATKLAILAGGGPAPGINSVIGAAAILAALARIEVLGLWDGMPCDLAHVRSLAIDEVSRSHFRGGSQLGTSRRFVPIPFRELLDPETGPTKVRQLDIASAPFAIARRRVIRLRRDDFDDARGLTAMTATAGLTVGSLRAQFEYLVAAQPPHVL